MTPGDRIIHDAYGWPGTVAGTAGEYLKVQWDHALPVRSGPVAQRRAGTGPVFVHPARVRPLEEAAA